MLQLLAICLTAFLLFGIEQQVYRKLWGKGLSVSVKFEDSGIFQGNTGIIKEVIENRKKLPLPSFKVKFQTDRHLVFEDDLGSRTTDKYYRNDVFQINGGEKITRRLEFKAGRRGYYTIGDVDLVASDFLMSTEMGESFRNSTEIYVYPKPFGTPEFLSSLRQLNGEALTRRHIIEDPFEYRGIREYQPFDDFRSINWKATARTDELKINQKNYTSMKSIRIFINLEDTGVLKREDMVETCMSMASTMADFFLKEGFQVGVYCNAKNILDKQAVIIEPSAGKGQLANILKAFALTDTSVKVYDTDSFFRSKMFDSGKGSFNICISPNCYDDWCRLLRDFISSGNDCVWFYPTTDKTFPNLEPELAQIFKGIHVDL